MPSTYSNAFLTQILDSTAKSNLLTKRQMAKALKMPYTQYKCVRSGLKKPPWSLVPTLIDALDVHPDIAYRAVAAARQEVTLGFESLPAQDRILALQFATAIASDRLSDEQKMELSQLLNYKESR